MNTHKSYGRRASEARPREGRMADDKGKQKALDLALSLIEKHFGKGSIMTLGTHDFGKGIEVIPTGSISLDLALGVGGVPRGRVIEIYGPEASGKTTLALTIVANAQKLGGVAAFIDAEHALDPAYSRALGVDTDNMLISQPDTGEQALEITEMLVRSGAVDVIAIDSVAALVPRAEIEGEMGDSHVGLQARLMSQALRKLAGSINRSKTCVIFINQIRMKIGVMFGNPETTSGGRALKFYSSVRLDIRRIGALKAGDTIVGNRTKVKVVKNKVAPPFRIAEFDIIYGKGISLEGDLLDLGMEHGVVTQKGTWFSYGDLQLGQGRERARAYLEEDAAVREELERKIREATGLVASPAEADAPTETEKAAEESPARKTAKEEPAQEKVGSKK